MSLLDVFKRLRSGASDSKYTRSWHRDGVRVNLGVRMSEPSAESLFDEAHGASATDSVLGAYLAQLAVEGLCLVEPEAVLIPWSQLYDLISTPDHQSFADLLQLPPVRGLSWL